MNTIQIPNTLFYEFQSSQDLVDETYRQILNTDFSWQDNTNDVNENVRWYSQNGYVQTNLGLTCFYSENLYNWFSSCLTQVSNIHFSRGVLEICDLWIAKHTFGQRSQSHSHKISVFSGLFYLTDQESSETVFHLDDPLYNFFEPYYGAGIRKRKQTYTSKPKSGKLLIWPSYISHSVNPHKEKNERYSIAFNTMLSGKIGEVRTGYCELNVRSISSPDYVIRPKY